MGATNFRVPAVVAAALLLIATPARAEHEVDHRYDVQGFVLGTDQRPLEGVAVEIRKGGQSIGGGRTDGDGRYAIRLHLHDSDIGETITVRAGNHQALIRMQAEYGNQSSARVHHLNFVGSAFNEKDLSGVSVPAWAYLLALPFAVWAAIYASDVIRRRARKRSAEIAPAQSGQAPKRKGRRRR
jgi:hypothetical protein